MRKLHEYCGFFRAGRRAILLCCSMFLAWNGFSEPFFNYAEFKAASEFVIPRKETKKEKSVSGNTGVKLSFRNADFRTYVTLPKTELKSLNETESFSEKLDFLEGPRFGAGIFLFKKTVPVTFKAGHNTYSKSVAKMKNPSPSSTANPLSKSFAFSTGIGASLPTLTGRIQPISYSLGISTAEQIFPVQFSAEGFFNEEKDGAASFSMKIPISRSVFVQQAFSAGRFYIENNSQILKKNNAIFAADFFNSYLAELCFHSPVLKLNFYSGMHESPYDKNPFWFKLDGRTSFKAVLLNFSYFAIPTTKDSPKAAPLVCASGICRTVEQASVNPQILFLFDDENASSLRLGFSALENWKVTATNTPVQLNTAKLRAGTSFESRFFDLRLEWTHSNILLEGEPPTKSAIPEEYYSYAASTGISQKTAKFSLGASYTNYPPKTEKDRLKEVYSADLKLAMPKLNLTTQAGIDFTLKDKDRTAGEIKAGASYMMRKKYLHASMKAEVKVPF